MARYLCLHAEMGSIEILVDYQRYVSRDTYSAILLYGYRYRLGVSLQYRVSVSIKHVFVHSRYKYLDAVFEQDQSYQVLTSCSIMVFEKCEMKQDSLIDS